MPEPRHMPSSEPQVGMSTGGRAQGGGEEHRAGGWAQRNKHMRRSMCKKRENMRGGARGVVQGWGEMSMGAGTQGMRDSPELKLWEPPDEGSELLVLFGG